MRDKAAKLWFSASSQIGLESIIAFFLAQGLSLINTHSGDITIVSDFGDPIVVEQSSLLNIYQKDNLVRFNFWMDASHNLFIEMRKLLDDSIALDFGLDGLDERQLNRLTEVFIALFVEHIGSGSRGLVVDWEGYSEGFDWLAWMNHSADVPPAWPEVIGVPLSLMYRGASPPASQYSRLDVDGFAILFGPRLNLTLDQPEQQGYPPRIHVVV